MLTSQEIAEQIAQQNQFFQGQSAMASQIGVSPFYGGGGGGYGMPSPFGAGRAPMAPPMAPPAGGGFSYGGGMFGGYGPGNRAGAFTGAAMGAAPFAMTTGLELASMTGWGRGLAPFVNPVSAFGMGRSMGMGFAGSTAMAGAAMLPAAALMHMGTSMAGGAMQQAQVGTAVSGYNFVNPAARGGQGFSRGDVSNITHQVRQLAYLPELLTSFDELSRIMPRLQQSGAMQGVRDASEFNRRFKEAIGTVREISKMIGTTMEEASEFFAHSRRVGFLGRDQQIRNAVNAQVTMATTGMTQQQVMQLQQTGADFATAVGAPRALGAAATTNLATQLGFAQQSGTIKAGALEDLTGQQGAAAVQAGAVQLANAAVRLAGTSTGQYMLAGAIEMDKEGRVSLNRGVMGGLARGDLNAADLRRRGSRLMGDRKFATAFKANQGRLAMEFAGQQGAQGFYSLIQGELERYGYGDDENAVRLVLQQQGIGEQESEIISNMARQSALGMGGTQEAVERIRRQQAGIRERYSPSAIWKRATTKVGQQITRPFEEMGQRVSSAVSRAFEDAADELFGNIVVTASKDVRDRYVAALGTGDRGAIAQMLSAGKMGGFASGGGGMMAGIGRFFGMGGHAGVAAFRDAAKGFGLGDLSPNATGAQDQLQARLRALEGGQLAAGVTVEGLAGNDKIQRGMAAIGQLQMSLMESEEFRNKSPAEQAAIVQQRAQNIARGNPMTDVLPGYTRDLQAGLAEMARLTPGQDATRLLMAAAAVARPEEERIGNARQMWGGGLGALDLAGLPGELHGAEADLNNRFKEVSADLQKDSKARSALSAIMGAPDAVRKRIIALMRAGKMDEAQKVAADENISLPNLSASQRDIVLRGHEAARSNPSKAKSELDAYDLAVRKNAAGAFMQGERQAAIEGDAMAERLRIQKETGVASMVQRVADAHSNFAKAIQGQDEAAIGGAAAALSNELTAAASEFANMDADKRDALVQAGLVPEDIKAGGERILGARRRLERIGKTATVEELVKRGFSRDVVTKLAGGGKSLIMTGEMRRQLEQAEGRISAAQVGAARTEAQTQQTKDEQMINTMKAIADAVIASSNMNEEQRGKLRETYGSNMGKSEPGKKKQ